MRIRAALLFAFAFASTASCADYDGLVRATRPTLDDAGESRCSVVKNHSRPLIVEWPASARGDLEVRMRSGVVAVRYIGCAMEVLDRCSAAGAYHYVPFTPKEDRLVIRDKSELFANLPMGAAGLEGKLESRGEIDLGMTLVGKYESDPPPDDALRGDCAEATHLVTGLTVGAFALSAGGAMDVGGGVSVLGVGGGAKAKSERETLSRDGDPTMCAKATLEDAAPPRWCGAVVRVEVVPVSRPLPATPRVDAVRAGASYAAMVFEPSPALLVSEPAPPAPTAPTAPRPPPRFSAGGVFPARPDPRLAAAWPKPRSPPSPCEESATSECMQRCVDGSAPSCLTLAHKRGAKDSTYWYTYACIGGSPEGCRRIGDAYARGEFGDPDAFTAEKWYGIAASLRP